MQKYELQFCPRCEGGFYCRSGNIGECQCFPVSLTEEQYNALNEQYGQCLCARCLNEIARLEIHDTCGVTTVKKNSAMKRIPRGFRGLLPGVLCIAIACVPDAASTDDALLSLLQSPSTGVKTIVAEEGEFHADTVTEATNISTSSYGNPVAAADGIGGTFGVYSMRYERTTGPFSYCKDHTTVPAYSQLPAPSGSFSAVMGTKDRRAAEQCVVLEWSGRRVLNQEGEDFRVYENGFEVGTPGSGNFFMEPLIVEISDNGSDWCGWNPQYVGIKETDPAYLMADGRYKSGGPNLAETRKQSNYLRFGGVQIGGNVANGDAFDLDDVEFGNSGSGADGRTPCSVTARNRMRLNGFVYIRLVTAWSRDTVEYPLAYDSFDAAADIDAVYAWSTADR